MKGGELPRTLSRTVCFFCRRSRPRASFRPTLPTPIIQRAALSTSNARCASERPSLEQDSQALIDEGNHQVLERLRIVPGSPSYFSAKPKFTDSLLELEAIERKYAKLPLVTPLQAPRVAWKKLVDFKIFVGGEPIKTAKYRKIEKILSKLNRIHPALIPQDVSDILEKYKRDIQPHLNVKKPVYVDQLGRAKGVGRRKTSSAVAWLVEGEGEVLINGKTMSQMFGRMHDRESALWALQATDRIDKYNVFALAKGGGTTGQAEALTLAVAKALMVHEPALKSVLRKAGCVTRDPRKVERKKPGKIKARKMPAWVKR